MSKTLMESRGTEDVLEQLRSHLPTFSPAERKAAEVVLFDPVAVLSNSITQLAATSDVSSATVIRMCNAIGLKGFQELKTQIAIQHSPFGREGKAESGHPVTQILQESAQALLDAAVIVDPDVIEQVATELASARRIHTVAVGTSSMLASDFAYRLNMLGLQATYVSDVHVQHVQAKMLSSKDVLFAISHTGSTFETLSAAQTARNAGALVVALTSFAHSPLTELCDKFIIAGSAETEVRIEASSSRLIHMSILDAIQIILRGKLPQADAYLKATAEVIAEHKY